MEADDIGFEEIDEKILSGFNPGADEESQTKANEYLECIRQSAFGWKTCIHHITENPHPNSHMRFLYFQLLEHFTRNKYESSEVDTKCQVRNFIMLWIYNQSNPEKVETSPFVISKAIQVFSLVFVKDFLNHWNTFFFDMASTLSQGPKAVEIYLRLLEGIDSEVIDPDILHTADENHHNSLIKNSMRETSVTKIVDTWHYILETYALSNPELVCRCLTVIGTYISWIDISFFANDRFINILIIFLLKTETREAAVDCLCGLVNKGMEPLDKLHLVETLLPVLQSRGLLDPIENDETDFTIKMGYFLNNVGTNLTDAFDEVMKSGGAADQVESIVSAIERKIPFLLKFMCDDSDYVFNSVQEFLKSYIHMLKQLASLNEEQRNNVHKMLTIMINKSKYTDSFDFEREGEDEADFLDRRKDIKSMYIRLLAVCKEIVLNYVTNIVVTTLNEWRLKPFEEIEIAIYLLYITGEALLASGDNYQSRDKNKMSEVEPMLHVLVTCGVNDHPHHVVSLQYLETIVRFEKFFMTHTEHIPDALLTFLSKCGFRNENCKVRSRCSFLFVRFIKALRSHLQTYAFELLLNVRELLKMVEPPEYTADQWLTYDDQLFLYEAVGVLIIAAMPTSQEKSQTFQEIIVPLLNRFNDVFEKLKVEENIKNQVAHAQLLCHHMAVCSRLSKAFSQQQSMKACGCLQIFVECLQVFLNSLQTPHQLASLQAGVRQFLHRMVVCLDDALLPYIAEASRGLLHYNDIQSVQEYIPLIVQIISKFKKDVVPFLQEAFVPIISAISAYLSCPVEENDEHAVRDKQMLQRQYFQFIAAIVSNNVIEVLNSQDIQTQEEVMKSIVQGAVDFPDPVSQKTCFSILKKLVDMWGGNDSTHSFTQFMYKNVVPACFIAPMKNTFDLNDAQTQAALSECSMCLKIIHNKQGEHFLFYLHDEYLPTLNLSSEEKDEFYQMLKSDNTTFKQYMKTFFKKRRS